ncbi:MAG TPA: hypothetical protein PLC15_04555 [Candidatus Obscuribacter sp.]|nr:hypothetical protein [Candidatus Obscuribacter sp.]
MLPKVLSKLFLSALALVLMVLAPPAVNSAESQQAVIFYRYISELYYAKSLKPVAKYWISTVRNQLSNQTGQRAVYELEKLKHGYVYKPKINVQSMQGQRCLMKGTGIASDLGRTFPCTLDVIMIFEEGTWRIQYYNWSATIMQ